MELHEQFVVGISDMKFSTRPQSELVTYSLGSCLGVTAYDPVAHIGGLLHALLPESNALPERARNNPFMFVSTGLNRMLAELEERGAQRRRMIVKAAGGADMRGDKLFRIGERNFKSLLFSLTQERLTLSGKEVGGTIPRTLSLYLDTGEVVVKTFGRKRAI